MRTASAFLMLVALPLPAQQAVGRAAAWGGMVIQPELAREEAQVAGRISPPLAARVTTRDGDPVEGARVCFRWLPGEVSGRFSSGLGTEIAVTGPDGVARAGRVRWEQRPGVARLEIIAAKEGERAEIVLPFEVTQPPAQFSPPKRRRAIFAFAGSAAITFLAGLAWAAR
jgi:hypothetical protein